MGITIQERQRAYELTGIELALEPASNSLSYVRRSKAALAFSVMEAGVSGRL
jgi:hypothetical protein